MQNLTTEKAKSILELLYELKARQIAEETGVEVEIKLTFKEGK